MNDDNIDSFDSIDIDTNTDNLDLSDAEYSEIVGSDTLANNDDVDSLDENEIPNNNSDDTDIDIDNKSKNKKLRKKRVQRLSEIESGSDFIEEDTSIKNSDKTTEDDFVTKSEYTSDTSDYLDDNELIQNNHQIESEQNISDNFRVPNESLSEENNGIISDNTSPISETSDIWSDNGAMNIPGETFETFTVDKSNDESDIYSDNVSNYNNISNNENITYTSDDIERFRDILSNETLSNATVIGNQYTEGQPEEMNGMTPLQHSILDNTAGTVTDAGFYEGARILPSDDSPEVSHDIPVENNEKEPSHFSFTGAFDSYSDDSILQPEKNDYISPVITEGMSKQVTYNDNIISSESYNLKSDSEQSESIPDQIDNLQPDNQQSDNMSSKQYSEILMNERNNHSSDIKEILSAQSSDMSNQTVEETVKTVGGVDTLRTNDFNMSILDKVPMDSQRNNEIITYRTGEGIVPESEKKKDIISSVKNTYSDTTAEDEHKENLLSSGKSKMSNSNAEETGTNSCSSSDEQKRTDDKSKTITNTEKTSEYKEDEVNQRQFVKHYKGKLIEELAPAGRAAINFISDSTTDTQSMEAQGYQQLQQIGKHIIILGDFGAAAGASMAEDNARFLKDGAGNAEKLISSGKLTQQDLTLSKSELNAVLKENGVSFSERWGVASNRDMIHDMMVTKETFQNMRDNNADSNHMFSKIGFENKQMNKILDSNSFYNTFSNAERFNTYAQQYFATSSNKLLSKFNPAAMSSEDLKKLIKNPELYQISSQDISILNTLYNAKNNSKIKALGNKFRGVHGIFTGGKNVLRHFTTDLRGLDCDVNTGITQYQRIYNAGKATFSVLKLSAVTNVKVIKLIGKIPPIKAFNNWSGYKVRKGVNTVKGITKKSMKGIGSYVRQSKAMRFTSSVKKRAVKSITDSSLVKTTKDAVHLATGTVKTASSVIANTKAARIAVKVGKKTAFGAKVTGHVVNKALAPIRAISSGISKIEKWFKKLWKYLLAACAVLLLAVILVIVVAALIQSSGTVIEGALYTSSTDEDIKDHMETLKGYDTDKYQKAMNLATKNPKHDASRVDDKGLYPDEAYNGVHLYRYGSPKTKDDSNADIYHNDIGGKSKNGYHIYYLDSEGNVIGNNTTNVKDIESLATVMIDNKYDGVDKTQYEALLKQLYTYTNPDPSFTVSDLYHKEGSDKFPYDGKTSNGKTYYCNDQSFYDSYNSAKSEGVNFYNEPVEKTDKGCEFDEDRYNSDMDAYNNGDREEEPNRDDYYYCPGHDALDCSYGYRDVNVYVTVLTKDDVYKAYENGKTLTYKIPKDYKCTEWEDKEVTLDFSAYSELTKAFDAEYTDGFGDKKAQDWCDAIYGTDWYDNYGVDGYSDSVSLSDGDEALSDEQIQEIMDSIGDVSEARSSMVNFAIGNVDKISYYWGGKAKCAGFDGNDFGKTIKSDYKGRNKKGLDCSGFVSWCYWSTTGYRPHGQNTSNFTTSLGLKKISANQLKPGDVGLENTPGSKTNHIGIFVGYADNGRAKWVHCAGAPSNKVVCNTTNCFKVYYKTFND